MHIVPTPASGTLQAKPGSINHQRNGSEQPGIKARSDQSGLSSQLGAKPGKPKDTTIRAQNGVMSTIDVIAQVLFDQDWYSVSG